MEGRPHESLVWAAFASRVRRHLRNARDLAEYVHTDYPLQSTLSAALLVFVDVLKEMPATLLMRPFGWDTLAVRIFEMTSEGEWARASLPALTLVLVGLLPVIGLIRRSARQIG